MFYENLRLIHQVIHFNSNQNYGDRKSPLSESDQYFDTNF
jgi:hypothetical protein